jgi:hypothetical protein
MIDDSRNDGFDPSWAGNYKGETTDAEISFYLSVDRVYCFTFGEAGTTYRGEYNKNFRRGVSKSSINWNITELWVTAHDSNSITLFVDWKKPTGSETAEYTLYRL